MDIYHYTTIDNLALILKSHKIRFMPLNQMDDAIEGRQEAFINKGNGLAEQRVNISRYIYASCWTSNAEENIALWKMYTSNARGVIIKLKKEMFYDFIENQQYTIIENTSSKIEHLIFSERDLFFRPVHYKPLNFNFVYGLNEGINNMYELLTKVGTHKSDAWKMQQESRFILYTVPVPKRCNLKKGFDKKQIVEKAICNKQYPEIRYIDLPIKDYIIEHVEIIMTAMQTF